MPNLGPVDIHLELTDRNLNARFYSEEPAGEMLKDNVEELNDKLEAKNYLLNATFSPAQKLKEDAAEDAAGSMAASSNGAAPSAETKYNFDTKA